MRDLKRFSDVVCGPIIAVRTSNDVPWRPTANTWMWKEGKRGVARVTWPLKFWGVKC